MSNKINRDDATLSASKDKGRLSRRGLFKKMMYGGAAVGAVGGTAKVADSLVTEIEAEAETNLQRAYKIDVAPGDKIIAEREHVLMSKEEKESMVEMFVDNYEKSHPES